MGFISGVLGDSGASLLTAIFALGVVLVLIVLGVWLLKWVFTATGKSARSGRGPRLSVVETLSLDGRRQLMLVRRDGVEHLVLTGGAQDVLLEAGIPVADLPPPTRRPVPIVASRRTRPAGAPPAQSAPAPSTTVPTPAAPPAAATAPTAIERLRDFGRTAPQPRPVSLRHTGLLKPGSNADNTLQKPDKSAARPLDSAKESAAPSSGGTGESVGGSTKSER